LVLARARVLARVLARARGLARARVLARVLARTRVLARVLARVQARAVSSCHNISLVLEPLLLAAIGESYTGKYYFKQGGEG